MARKSRINEVTEQIILQEFDLYRAGLYLRLSDLDGDDIEQNSIGNQKKLGFHYLSEHPDIQLIDTYIDHGCSGMNYKRDGFVRMKKDLDKGIINCVIVKDISRLGRNFIITSEYVEQIFPQMGVRLICINDDYDSIDKNVNQSALTLPLKMVMNESYVKDTAKKIRASIGAKMRSGEFLPSAGSIPYGYLRNAERITFDIDPEAAGVVLDIFRMRSRGMMFNAIAKALNEQEVLCPGKLRLRRGLTTNPKYENAEWVRGTIRKITNDPVYIGCRVHGKIKRDNLGEKKTHRSKDEWQIVENAHEPIVPKSLFETVQNVNAAEIERRNGFDKRADAAKDYRQLFHGKIFCADCGSPMMGFKGCARPDAKTPSRIAFDCNGYKYSNHAKCSCHYIRQETVFKAITDLLNSQVAIAVDVERLVNDVKQMPGVITHQTGINEHLKTIVMKRKNIESKTHRLLVDLTERLINRDEYDYMKTQYMKQIEKLTEEENQISLKFKELGDALNTTGKWLSAIKSYHKLPELNRDIFDRLIDRIVVFDRNTVKIELSYADPYKPLMSFIEKVEAMLNAG